MALQDGPTNVELNGLNLINVLDTGAEIRVDAVTGWDGPTQSTLSLTQRSRRSGAWAGDAFSGPRHIVVTGTIWSDPYSLVDAMDRFVSAIPLEPGVVRITQYGSTRWAPVQHEDEPIVTRKSREHAEWSLQLASEEWRRFGSTLTPVPIGLPSSSGGFSFPLSFPFNIPAVVTSGTVSLVNPGNATGPVKLRIDGPVPGPIVTHVESGRVIALQSGLVLAAGEYLTIDPEREIVLANGQASRNAYLTSREWFGFEPGSNTYAFSAAGNNADARLSVEAIESWR